MTNLLYKCFLLGQKMTVQNVLLAVWFDFSFGARLFILLLLQSTNMFLPAPMCCYFRYPSSLNFCDSFLTKLSFRVGVPSISFTLLFLEAGWPEFRATLESSQWTWERPLMYQLPAWWTGHLLFCADITPVNINADSMCGSRSAEWLTGFSTLLFCILSKWKWLLAKFRISLALLGTASCMLWILSLLCKPGRNQLPEVNGRGNLVVPCYGEPWCWEPFPLVSGPPVPKGYNCRKKGSLLPRYKQLFEMQALGSGSALENEVDGPLQGACL